MMPIQEETVIREILANAHRRNDADYVVKALADAGGYSAIVEDTSLWRKYGDLIDPLINQRVIDVRNALRETGWDDDGSQPMHSGPLQKGKYTLDYEFKRTPTNAINTAFKIKGVPGFFMSDRLVLSAREMAEKINLGIPGMKVDIEKLRVAHEAAMPRCMEDARSAFLDEEMEDLRGILCGDVYEDTKVFLTRAHNTIPLLLEAVAEMRQCAADTGYNFSTLEKLGVTEGDSNPAPESGAPKKRKPSTGLGL